MSVFIKEIQLKNWFNYFGDYEDNIFQFNEGLNIIVGDNNCGKTKLHNAVRWILKNKVILESEDKSYSEETGIDKSNLFQIVNRFALHTAKIGDNITIGVKIRFIEIKSENTSKDFILTKEISFTKYVSKPEKFYCQEKVEMVDSLTKKPRSYPDSFENVSKKIISDNFLSYFLIEGEQLGRITPLSGEQLKRTIYALVNLNLLDDIVEKSSIVHKKIESKKFEIEKLDKNTSAVRKENIKKIEELKIEISDDEVTLKQYQEELIKNETLINNYRLKAESSKAKKDLVSKLDKIKFDLEHFTTLKDNSRRKYISKYLDSNSFSISKIKNDEQVQKSIEDEINKIKSFIYLRRAELDTKLSEKEERIIMALEKSQPKPEIIDQMITDGHCFVCNNPLSKESILFMREKLIPFFNDELENDEDLNNLTAVHGMFTNLLLDSKRYFNCDLEFFDEINDEIINYTEKIIDLTEKKMHS